MSVAPAHEGDPRLGPAGMLAGSWTTEGEESVAMHVVPVELEGAVNAFYVEYANADALDEVTRQEVWRLYEAGDGWRLRVLGFHFDRYAQLKYSGFWVKPGMLPPVQAVEVYPKFDIDLEQSESGVSGASRHPYPVAFAASGEAVEQRSSFESSEGSMTWRSTEIDASGESQEGETLRFTRYEPEVSVTQREDGLVIIDLKEGTGEGAENGDAVEVHYTGWNTRYQIFDTSRQPNRTTFTVTLPGRVIKGWQEGLVGMKEGGVRRLIIPGELAYGPRGNPPTIGPNETLTFDIECVSVTEPEGDQ